jgi:hypothetical protein
MPGLRFRRQINAGTDHAFDRPSGTGPLCIFTQALRAWLLSDYPSGTKTIAPRSASHCLSRPFGAGLPTKPQMNVLGIFLARTCQTFLIFVPFTLDAGSRSKWHAPPALAGAVPLGLSFHLRTLPNALPIARNTITMKAGHLTLAEKIKTGTVVTPV